MTVTINLTFASYAEAIGALTKLGAETPKAETPKAETPKAETPKAETPKAETPKADAVDYATLSKAVLKLHGLNPAATGEVAKSLGLDNFKPLKEAPAEKVAAAHAAVLAKIAELGAA